jgi:hypothetical protein
MRGQLQFWLLAVLLACSGGLSCTERDPSGASTPVICDLHVIGASIQYKGNMLPLPGPLEAWERVLGRPSRQVQTASTSYVWDQAGIEVAAQEPGGELLDFFVLLVRPDTINQDLPDLLQEPPEYWPHSPFAGRLCVDGGRLSASTRIEDINRAKQGQKFRRGYRRNIYSYDIMAPLSIYVRIDLADNMRPRSFSMSIEDGPPRSPP